MASDFIVEVGRILAGAIVGGAVTAATALPFFNTKLTKLATEVQSMKESCVSCKSGMDRSIQGITKDVRDHREDDEKHYTKASDKLLNDILIRVMRIESTLLNGHRQSEN